MTPKEKANELYDKFIGTEGRLNIKLKLTGYTKIKREAKKHSLIAVDEILNIYHLHKKHPMTKYYSEVRQEIAKL